MTGQELYGWHLHLGKTDYLQALNWQRGLVRMREQGFARDTIITVEHPPVITVGKDGHLENYADLDPAPIQVERGGDVTYHGPGQLVVYFIFNLARRGRDLHLFMNNIQAGIIETLADYDLPAEQGSENTGVWVGRSKIASIGVAVKRWISFHGAAVNLNTRLDDFKRIQPCGLKPEVMTSTEQLLGRKVRLRAFARRLVGHYGTLFETRFTPIDLDSLAEDVESQAGGETV
jgi:lipoate-protein ligase B